MKEESFGIVPLKPTAEGWSVFLIQHRGAKHWGFPKGKGEEGETPLESAARELLEETGLQVVELIEQTPFTEEYIYTRHGKRIHKRVFYFPALVSGHTHLQENEIQDGKWVLLSEAEKHLTFEESKKTCKQLEKRMTGTSAL